MKFKRNKRQSPDGWETLMVWAEQGKRLYIDSAVVSPKKILIIELPEKEGTRNESGD